MTTVDSKLKHHKQEPIELIHVLYRHAEFFWMGAFSLLKDHRFLQLVAELEQNHKTSSLQGAPADAEAFKSSSHLQLTIQTGPRGCSGPQAIPVATLTSASVSAGPLTPAPSPPATFPQTLQSVEEPCCNSGHPEFSSHTLSASLFFSIPSGPLILPKPVSPATHGPGTPFPSLSLSALDSAAVKIYFAAAMLESKVNLHSGGGKNLPWPMC